MATNNFKPFANANSANVTTQADYEALAALLTGFQAGKASSAQINKALRQSSVMAYVLAQFISDSAVTDVLDNGTTATILTNLKAGLIANANSSARSRKLTASGSFTVPAGVTTLYVTGCGGGGGGGGGASSSTNSSTSTSGGSGGAAQAVIKTPINVTPGQVISFTIGSGGAGGSGGATGSNGGVGASGGSTIFGSLLTLSGGGAGGAGAYGTSTIAGGAGGTGYPTGGNGMSAVPTGGTFVIYASGGAGASTAFGGGGAAAIAGGASATSGGDAFGYGASGGGGGAFITIGQGGTGKSGGAGAPGLLILEW